MFQFSLTDVKDADVFYEVFKGFVKKLKTKPVFLCIGTNKSKIDCFGPTMGSILKSEVNFFVYGSLKREVNALNFVEVYNFIKTKHKNSPVIIIDNVFIKNSKNVKLIFKDNGIFPHGISNKTQFVGDASILINSFEYNSLDNFNFLYKIILEAIKKFNFYFE